MGPYFIGVDVGTNSVRAGIFTIRGLKIAEASHPIQIFKPQSDFVEQSSDDIWRSVCIRVKAVVFQAQINPDHVKGIAFDATCSLVVLDKKANR